MPLATPAFDTRLSGAGSATRGNLSADSLKVTLAGAGNVEGNGTVSSQESKYNTANTGVNDSKLLVKAVVSGQDERLNWPRLMEVMSAALPREPQRGSLLDAGIGFVDLVKLPNSWSNIRSAVMGSKSPTRIASALSGQKKFL